VLRIGQGWDIHRLVENRPFRLGGIEVPFDRGPLGHSDGDVVMHALCDALLGAVAAGDIGSHFPDTDPRYSGADSAVLLAHVVRLLTERGCTICNVDVTILAERPRLAPHLPRMQARIAEVMGVDLGRVSLKAKTMEGLDAIGHGQAVGAAAVALVEESGKT